MSKTAEEVLKENCLKATNGMDYEHNVTGQAILDAMDEYAKLKTSELEKEKDEALRLLNDALKLIHSLPDLIGDKLGEQAKQLVKSEIDKALSL